MRQAKSIGILLAFAGVMALSSCATISEDQCLAGNWAERGYKDGLKGRSSSRIADYAYVCSEFGVRPDQTAYLANYDQGVSQYCTYERGFARGERGESYNQVCSGDLAIDFAPGYEAGREVYAIKREYHGLINDYDRAYDYLIETRTRLREEELSKDGRKKLLRREKHLERKLYNLKVDIRAFERVHGFRRRDLGY